MKVNVTLNDELLNKIDKYAESNYMTRSGFISLACNQLLQQSDMVEAVKQMTIAMQQIAKTGFVDAETREQLEAFQKLAQYTAFGNK